MGKVRTLNLVNKICASIYDVEKLLKAWVKDSRFKGKSYIVGGYVRDKIIGIVPKDVDVVVEMENGGKKFVFDMYKDFKEFVSQPIDVKSELGIWGLVFKEDILYRGQVYNVKGMDIEVAQTQKETFPNPMSRQRAMEYAPLEKDIERRDFTVNSVLEDLTSGEILDLTGTSKHDIEKGILRGHPGVDFDLILAQDPLRMIRLIRFEAKYGWKVPKSVLKAVKRNAHRIKIVSAERIMEELKKVAKIGKLEKAVRIMQVTGLLKYVLPEIEAMRGVEHDKNRGHHQEGDVYKHTLLVLRNAKPGVLNQFAALWHDIGKPQTQTVLEDAITFQSHDKVGGEIVEAVMRKLRFEKDVIKKIRKLVEMHMRPHQIQRQLESEDNPKIRAKMIRKFIRTLGEETVDAVLDLAEADQLGNLPADNKIPYLRKEIDEIREIDKDRNKLPVLNGEEIMDILNIKPSPLIGKITKFLLDLQDENPDLTKSEAIRFIQKEFGE
jgi:poly(A) polymerase